MERVSKTKIERKDGYLYYLGSDGYVWGSPMKSNPRGKKYKAGMEMVVRKPGYLYYVDKMGYVARAMQKRGGKRKKMGVKIIPSTTKHLVPGKIRMAPQGKKARGGKQLVF